MPQKTQQHDWRQTVQLCVHGQTIVICYNRSDGKLSVVSNTKLWTWDRLLHLPNHEWAKACMGCTHQRKRSCGMYIRIAR